MTENKKDARKAGPHYNYDSPWKQIIEELLESFLEFFFPKETFAGK
jgi:hypothetical protein